MHLDSEGLSGNERMETRCTSSICSQRYNIFMVGGNSTNAFWGTNGFLEHTRVVFISWFPVSCAISGLKLSSLGISFVAKFHWTSGSQWLRIDHIFSSVHVANLGVISDDLFSVHYSRNPGFAYLLKSISRWVRLQKYCIWNDLLPPFSRLEPQKREWVLAVALP